MNNQRGSVTVIAIVMLLFLMVIAVAWLPMMTMEKKAASSDYREQQAWYAAEAGYKRAIAQLDAEKGSVGYWYWLSREAALKGEGRAFAPNRISWSGAEGAEADGVWYAAAINYKDGDTVIDVVDGYKPVKGTEYSITAVGSCQGVRKVIRKTHTPGGIDIGGGGGDSGGEEALELPGLVQAGGTVTITNSQAGYLNGNLYGSGFFDSSGAQFTNGYTQGKFPDVLKTHIPDSVFRKESYQNLQNIPNDYVLKSQTNYFWDLGKTYSDWFELKAQNAGGMVIFVDNSSKSEIYTNGILGPSAGLPVTIIFTNKIVINGKISGNIRMFFASDFTLGNYNTAGDLLMLMSNGEMRIESPVKYGFLSSDKNITIANRTFHGQAQAKGNFKTEGTIHYSDAVLKADGFTVPKGMK